MQAAGEGQRAGTVGAAGQPLVDHPQGLGVAGGDHLVGLDIRAARQADLLRLGLAPAVGEVGLHALGDEEEDLLAQLRDRPEDLLEVRLAVGLGVAVGEVEGRHDAVVVARGDAGLAEEAHHAGEAVDVALHHHRSHGDAGLLRQAVLLAELLGELRVVRLGPGGDEVLGEGDGGLGVAAC